MDYKAKLAFIDKVAPWARASHEKYGIPASVVIAQAILESSDQQGNWGQSILAAKYNNFFGIKDSRLSADGYCELLTHEYVGSTLKAVKARFESFKSPDRSFDCHARLLATLPRYQRAMAEADDPLVFVVQLYECGYSTNPSYPKILAELITQFHLQNYDAAEDR